jgi:hypothetical protein
MQVLSREQAQRSLLRASQEYCARPGDEESNPQPRRIADGPEPSGG